MAGGGEQCSNRTTITLRSIQDWHNKLQRLKFYKSNKNLGKMTNHQVAINLNLLAIKLTGNRKQSRVNTKNICAPNNSKYWIHF